MQPLGQLDRIDIGRDAVSDGAKGHASTLAIAEK